MKVARVILFMGLAILMACSSEKKEDPPSESAGISQQDVDKAVHEAIKKNSDEYQARIKTLMEKVESLESLDRTSATEEKLPQFVSTYVDQLEKLDTESEKLQTLIDQECQTNSAIDSAEASTIQSQITANLNLLVQMEKDMESHRTKYPNEIGRIVKDIQMLKKFFEWLQKLPCLNAEVTTVGIAACPAPYDIQGKVVADEAVPLPIESAVVTITGAEGSPPVASVKTDAHGLYKFSGLTHPYVMVSVTHDGYDTINKSISATPCTADTFDFALKKNETER